jgi:hypothetical protein
LESSFMNRWSRLRRSELQRVERMGCVSALRVVREKVEK